MGSEEGMQAEGCKLPTSHAEAQRKYREKNLEETRAKARDRMRRMRARRTPEEVEKASRQRKEGDADYREFPSRRRRIAIKCDGEKGACYELNVGGRERRCPHGFWSVCVAMQPSITLITPLYQHFLLLSSLPMVCRLSVEHNGNYKNDSDHDSNTRKFWFLVFGKGLYTKKTQAGLQPFTGRTRTRLLGAITAYTYSTPARRPLVRGLGIAAGATLQGATKPRTPAAHQSDADSDTDKDTEEPRARARVLDRVARQVATAPRKASKTVNREVVVKSERLASTARAALTPVKRAAALTPKPKAEPASPKKLPLYADGDDTDDDDLFKSDSSAEVALASVAPSRLSSLEADEDVTMPLSHPVAPISPTLSSVSSLPTTSSAAASNFSSISRAFRATAPPAAGPSAGPSASRATASAHMLFNRITRVLYDDPKSAFAEKSPGESMQVVDAREIIPFINGSGTSSSLLYNRKTKVLYDDLRVAVEERKPGESMQVLEPDTVVPWISGLGR
ncbi:hypothetical protein B0H14DRAFT_2625552 [Mycena olivaceomarginata]|nr:hypothetical protein B0H14DRAFT_2625552 [Mycena olivaceomarginata]